MRYVRVRERKRVERAIESEENDEPVEWCGVVQYDYRYSDSYS